MSDILDPLRPFWTSETVKRKLHQVFAPSDLLLAEYVLSGTKPSTDDPNSAGHARLRLAAIRLSQGNLDELAKWLYVAEVDYRDLINAAENSQVFETNRS